MLSVGDPVAMKELAQRADVSLATLYRYFPSKDHLLLAIVHSRYEQALARVQARGGTVRERVTSHLLREFRAEQREPRLTAALARALTETSRSYSEMIERIEHVHLRVLAAAGAPLSDQQHRMLPIVRDLFGAATRRWLAGVSSPAQARFEIRAGCWLLDLPDETVAAELGAAASADPA
jgi:AcrR family transcriptional regulator